jgi:dTDP-4-dehydrorhamnose reductase
MTKRVLVVGAAGQLGKELVSILKERGYSVEGVDRAEFDIVDGAKVEECLAAADPQLVINAAAYNQVDIAEQEPQAAFQVNALAVRNLAVACRQTDAALVHFSTDYVFDGRAGRPYVESDVPHPLGAYGVSKLAGEFYAQAYLDRALVIRTSGVFGPGGLYTARGNFVELMLRLGRGDKPIRVVEDHVASPTYAPELALRTILLAEKHAAGVYHIGGGLPISWFDYAKLIFEKAGLTPELRPTNEREYRAAAHRPRFSALSNSKMESEGLPAMPPLALCVERYLEARGHMLAESPVSAQ